MTDLKKEMLELLQVPDNWDKWDFQTKRYSFEDVEAVCASIAEKRIKIARLEGMIEVYRKLKPYLMLFSEDTKNEIRSLEKQLEELKAGK